MNSEDFEHEQDENENERDDGDEVEPAAARERHVRLPHGGSDEAHDAVHLQIQWLTICWYFEVCIDAGSTFKQFDQQLNRSSINPNQTVAGAQRYG